VSSNHPGEKSAEWKKGAIVQGKKKHVIFAMTGKRRDHIEL
jgi:hypothetical protein